MQTGLPLIVATTLYLIVSGADAAAAPGKRIYVGNLPAEATSTDVRELFSEYGEVEVVNIEIDRTAGRPRGFGYVEMDVDVDVDDAIEELDGRTLGDRVIDVAPTPIPGHPWPGDDNGAGDDGSGVGGVTFSGPEGDTRLGDGADLDEVPEWMPAYNELDMTQTSGMSQQEVSVAVTWMSNSIKACEGLTLLERRRCTNDTLQYQSQINHRIGRGINSNANNMTRRAPWMDLADKMTELRAKANELRRK